MANPNYDQLLSTTLENYRKQLTDNVFSDRVLLWWLKDKNRTRMLSGGHTIVEPLIYAEGEAGSYSEWEQVAITPQDGITAAEFPWRQLYATIAISGLQELQNNGEEEIINLLEAKVMQAEETLKERVNTMLIGDGTGNSGKDFLGLEALIGDSGTVGGIDSDAPGNEYWQSYVKDMTGANVDTLRAELTTAFNTSAKGNDTVKCLLGSQDVFELYEGTLVENVRYQDVKAANQGFSNLMFKQVPFYWDDVIPDGDVYGLNPKYLTLVGHKNRWFKQSKFTENPIDSAHASSGAASFVDARYAVITAVGNLTIRNRKRHFKVTGVGASGGGGGGGE
jgi:hypothetical protein